MMSLLPWHLPELEVTPVAPPELLSGHVRLSWCQILCACPSQPRVLLSSSPWAPLQCYLLRDAPLTTQCKMREMIFPSSKSLIPICSYLNYLSICTWCASPFIKGRFQAQGPACPLNPSPQYYGWWGDSSHPNQCAAKGRVEE